MTRPESALGPLPTELPQSYVIFNGETGIFEDPYRKTAPQIDPRMHGNGHRHVPLFVPHRQMAAALPCFHKALCSKKPHQLKRSHLGHAGHAGKPTENASTRTRLSC